MRLYICVLPAWRKNEPESLPTLVRRGAKKEVIPVMNEDFFVEDWEKRPKKLRPKQENLPFCSAKLATRLADRDFEKFSESEQSEWTEHAKACPVCEDLLIEHRRIKELFRAFSSSERYPSELKLTFPSHLLASIHTERYPSEEKQKTHEDASGIRQINIVARHTIQRWEKTKEKPQKKYQQKKYLHAIVRGLLHIIGLLCVVGFLFGCSFLSKSHGKTIVEQILVPLTWR